MGRPRLHDDRTERELLAAAEALLAESGASALSVRAVADAAGTTSRAIYSVFGGKDGLLRALFREGFRALSARLDALPQADDPLEDVVNSGVLGFRLWALERPDLFRLAFNDPIAVLPADDAVAGVQAFDRLRARIARCVAEGLVPAEVAAEFAVSFHATCEGLAGLEARGRFPPFAATNPERTWRSALTAVVRGYSRAPAPI